VTDWGIGIVGLGGIAGQHLKAYQARGLPVVAGADPDPRAREVRASEYGISAVYESVTELVADPRVRVVDVTAPHYLRIREPIFQAAAEAGKAIFCQKPLAETLEEARTLVRIADSGGVPLMVNQNSLFAPGFLALEPYLRDDAWVGMPYYFQVENRDWMDPSRHPWYGKSHRWVTANMGIHHYALIRHWFGDADSVYALFCKDPSQTGAEGETLSVLSVKFRNGVSGVVINNWCYRGDRPRAHAREEVVIQGTRGAITGDAEGICVTTAGDHSARIYPEIRGAWFPDAFGASMNHFLEALDTGRPYLCSGHDNLKTVAIAEAAYLSAEHSREVKLAELGA
jgi:predicted dehydrogenase